MSVTDDEKLIDIERELQKLRVSPTITIAEKGDWTGTDAEENVDDYMPVGDADTYAGENEPCEDD
jgi:hypothetical protein